MKKYVKELKQVTWPASGEVVTNFWVVVVGVILLACFFFGVDMLITQVFEALYS